jgi:4-amino-4-deoxy-L-arabinose transferase-like glycosyltransferase
MSRALCAVAALVLACLLFRASRVGLAGDWVDPVSRISAQDEALYSHIAIRMAHQGGWLTPRFMERYALYKPPLLYWLAGLSAKIAGVSPVALRFPVLLICALAAALVFWMASAWRGWQAGIAAVLLLNGDHLWHVLSTMCMTDALLVSLYIASAACLVWDPRLESRRPFWCFAVSVAAAILSKSVAGVIPLGTLALYSVLGPPKQRPTLKRALMAGVASVALALPWFLYQLAAHPRWFWREHILIEILGHGAGPPPQTWHETQARFYWNRIEAIDAVLVILALIALPKLVRALRQRSAPATLLVCWLILPVAAALGWSYRNVAYLLPAIPALAVIAATCSPFLPRRPLWLLAVAAVAFVFKTSFPEEPWGISFQRGTVQALSVALDNYAARHRPNELILVGMDDDLYASTLPLARLRYALIMASLPSSSYVMPFDEMGIILTSSQFNDPSRWEPEFHQRLHEWGLDSAGPIGSLVLAPSMDALAETIRSHPHSDFLLPDTDRAAVGPTHEVVEVQPRHLLLLAR